MGNNCYNMVVTVLLLVGSEKARAAQNPCDNCEAGTFCRKYNPVCKSCPPSTYSSIGGQPNCELCRVCEGFKKPCSSTHNAECECTEGFHCLGPTCTRCEKDCRPGQELTEQGCKNCSRGTFNDQNGAGICRPWTNCSLDGRAVLKNGTKEQDVVCGAPVVSFSPGTATAVTAPEGEPVRRSLQVCAVLLALTVALLLVLNFIRFSVPKWIRIFKQHKLTPRSVEETAGDVGMMSKAAAGQTSPNDGDPTGCLFRELRVLYLFHFRVNVNGAVLFLAVWWAGKRSSLMTPEAFKKAIGAAQEEDACSCRFPEEEEGGAGGGYEL
ncbi:Tumor necrosis factor receptor superfamily member 9 [Apodemus speciosus]|uniref:Tumor necrosis factor receptor superfamily member 9 n=1 Tax=Apodemus speciosus TaxID=105296 RepID=A0ABQ0EQF6_APOSI